MKLILCPLDACWDIVTLRNEPTFCHCRQSWGQWVDNLNATYGGKAVPLAIGDRSLIEAKLKHRRQVGPRKNGFNFDGWVMPKSRPGFDREEEGS